MFDTSNDLPPSTRQSVIDSLNEHLADAIDLQLQAKQAHWNADMKHVEQPVAARDASRS